MDNDTFNETMDTLNEHIDWIQEHDPRGVYEFRVSVEFVTKACSLLTTHTSLFPVARNNIWFNGYLMIIDRQQNCPLIITRKDTTQC